VHRSMTSSSSHSDDTTGGLHKRI